MFPQNGPLLVNPITIVLTNVIDSLFQKTFRDFEMDPRTYQCFLKLSVLKVSTTYLDWRDLSLHKPYVIFDEIFP